MNIFNSKKDLFLFGTLGMVIAFLCLPKKIVFVNIGNVSGDAYLNEKKVKK